MQLSQQISNPIQKPKFIITHYVGGWGSGFRADLYQIAFWAAVPSLGRTSGSRSSTLLPRALGQAHMYYRTIIRRPAIGDRPADTRALFDFLDKHLKRPTHDL